MAAQGDSHAGQQFADAKRFAEIVIRPGVQRGNFVFFGITRRQHNHRNGAPLA
ncbi:hypothetical protein D3C72_1975950 [compost metagenome]